MLVAFGLVTFIPRVQAVVTFTNLYNFGVFTNGADPSGLVQGNDGCFYGTTSRGGTNGGYGAVFKISPEGAVSSVYSFSGAADGAYPAGLVQGTDGNFYGTAGDGGSAGRGMVFKISTNGILTTLYSFTNGVDGEYPGGLIQGSDGNFYGTIRGNNDYLPGSGNYGRVFKITPGGSFTTLHAFTDGLDGAEPVVLLQGNDGNLYGMTLHGGTNGLGAIFRLSTTPGGILVVLHSFANVNGGPDAILPQSLIQASNGSFYGTTEEGGTNGGYGTVFQMSSGGAVTVLHSFTGGEDGGFPTSLVQGRDSNLYGTTQGATNSSGSVFKISLNGELTSLYFFTNLPDGVYPAGLIQGGDGNFYGTIVGLDNLGSFNSAAGAVFKITPTGNLTNLYSFGYDNGGADPQAGLVQGKDGSFYGTTSEGGTGNAGTVFKINASGNFANLYSFTNGNDGANPEGSLVQGSDGYLCGTTHGGGAAGYGTVFKISTNGLFTNLYSFANIATTTSTDGADPEAGLVVGRDGNFYGTTYDGGYYFAGNVFRITPKGVLTSLYSFFGYDDGANPQAGLVQGRDGNFYGTTSGGGSGSAGTVFRVSAGGQFRSLYSFTNGADGASPQSGLVQGSDGDFYGTAYSGGSNGVGTVFKLSSSGLFSILYSFTGDNDGSFPEAALIQASDGCFYGTASQGGSNGFGTVFKISAGGEFTCIYSFTGGEDGASPDAGVVQGSDGNFYGTTPAGGIAGNGAFFMISTGIGPLRTETTKPTLTVTTPTANENFTTNNPALDVSGTAKDKESVTGVFYQLNGGSWTAASTSDGFANWTGSVTMTAGTNTLLVYAQNAGNNPVTNKVSFKWTVSGALVIVANGNGAVSPKADLSKSFTVGVVNTVTAEPGRNWIFESWTSNGVVIGTNAALKFVLTTTNTTTLQVNFVTNVFLAAAGTYHGLFAPTNVARDQMNSGSFQISVTSAGIMSGSLDLAGQSVSLSPQKLSLSGAATIISKRPLGESSLTTTLELDFDDQSVTGTVSDGSTFTAQLEGDRDVFSAAHKAADFSGAYTLIIPGTNDATVGPYGVSYGTANVSSLGAITFAGNLADGTPISQSSVVSKDGYWPLYVSLYGGKGSLWGWNLFTNQTIVSASALSWINETNSSKTAVYRSGFTNQNATVMGGLYVPSLALPVNFNVILEGGDLPFAITNGVTLAPSDKISLTNAVDETNKLKLTVTKSTGVISGSFANPSNPKQTIKVNGVILQGQTNAQGYFLGTNQSGTSQLDQP
ncbi:MAG: beta strand repeat-containing protein [Limisphaerales bacterium]